jgi:hypothetical protein
MIARRSITILLLSWIGCCSSYHLSQSSSRHVIALRIHRNFIHPTYLSRSTDKMSLQSTNHDAKVIASNAPQSLANEDDVYNYFLDQIKELSNSNEDISYDDSDISEGAAQLKKELVEEATLLEAGCPIEFYYKGRVSFGNFIGRKASSNALIVQLPSAEQVTIDVGQVISCWDQLADEEVPSSTEQWIQVTNEALEILGIMSPRKSNLEEFWKMISRRGTGLPVDSLDLGVYIFQERSFRSWANPYVDAGDSNVMALSASQRYVAALLLHNDIFHFKRKMSTAVASSENKPLSNDLSTMLVMEGGYSALDEGISIHREGDVLLDYYQLMALNTTASSSDIQPNVRESPFKANTLSKQLRALEVYSMSPVQATAPPPAVKHILKRLKLPLSPTGAKQMLLAMNHQSKTASPRKRAQAGSNLLTPWKAEVLEEASALSTYMENKRIELRDSGYAKAGKRTMSGRMDYRINSAEHPVICIDNKRAAFLDDGFSFSPKTNEILIHVTDVMESLRRYESLQQVAKERVSSLFLPTGPLHMLPPQALDALKLSSSAPNEVLTVAVEVDFETGKILGYRFFNAIIGPVFMIDLNTADELLEGVGVVTDSNSNEILSARLGYPRALLQDLFMMKKIVQKMIVRNPWIDEYYNQMKKREFNLDKKTGTFEGKILEKTMSNRLVNALLTIYSNATVEYCYKQRVNVPIVWENRDRTDSKLIRRFATQPLRNWLSQLQQRQFRAALNLEPALDRKDCAMAVSYVNSKRTGPSEWLRTRKEG